MTIIKMMSNTTLKSETVLLKNFLTTFSLPKEMVSETLLSAEVTDENVEVSWLKIWEFPNMKIAKMRWTTKVM